MILKSLFFLKWGQTRGCTGGPVDRQLIRERCLFCRCDERRGLESQRSHFGCSMSRRNRLSLLLITFNYHPGRIPDAGSTPVRVIVEAALVDGHRDRCPNKCCCLRRSSASAHHLSEEWQCTYLRAMIPARNPSSQRQLRNSLPLSPTLWWILLASLGYR